jgi:hypothetical protein
MPSRLLPDEEMTYQALRLTTDDRCRISDTGTGVERSPNL